MEEQQKKKSKRKLWIILAIVLIAVAVGWFVAFIYVLKTYKPGTTFNITSGEEQRRQEALTYLEERYGEEFEIISYRGMGYAYDYVQMYAWPKSNPDDEHQFEIQGRLNKKKKMEYTDTYVMIKLTDEYAACVDEIIDEYFDDYKFYLEFSSEWVTVNLPPDTKVEDLFELRANVDYPLPRLFIFMKSSQGQNFKEENIKAMGGNLQKWGYRGEIYLTCYFDDTYYEKKNNENKRNLLEGERNSYECHWVFIEDNETILYD